MAHFSILLPRNIDKKPIMALNDTNQGMVLVLIFPHIKQIQNKVVIFEIKIHHQLFISAQFEK